MDLSVATQMKRWTWVLHPLTMEDAIGLFTSLFPRLASPTSHCLTQTLLHVSLERLAWCNRAPPAGCFAGQFLQLPGPPDNESRGIPAEGLSWEEGEPRRLSACQEWGGWGMASSRGYAQQSTARARLDKAWAAGEQSLKPLETGNRARNPGTINSHKVSLASSQISLRERSLAH